MKVTLNFQSGFALVEKEDGDSKFYNGGWANAESTFLYHVKKVLQKMGYDVVKVRMSKDRHLVSDTQQYIRTRKYMETPQNTDGEFAIYNSSYMTQDAGLKFNETGKAYLTLVQ